MVNEEHGNVADEDHVYCLRDVDAETEHDQVHPHLGRAVHEVGPESKALLEHNHSKDAGDAGGDPGEEGEAPLVRPHGAGPDVGGDPGEQEDGAQELTHWAEEQQLGSEADVTSSIVWAFGHGGDEHNVEQSGDESFYCNVLMMVGSLVGNCLTL